MKKAIFILLSLISAAALLLSYAAALIPPHTAWFLTIFGILFVPIFILTALCFIVAIFRRSRLTALLMLVLLPSILVFGKHYKFKAHESEVPDIKMVSYNVGLFAHSKDSEDGSSRVTLADSIVTFLKDSDADIIMLQEFYLPAGFSMDRFLKTRFPEYNAEYYVRTDHEGSSGNVTLSRYPIVRKGRQGFENSTNLALWTDVSLPVGVMRIFNCHLESYNVSPGKFLKDHPWEKIRASIGARHAQVDAILEDIRQSPVRSIVAGDFNDTPLSWTYRKLSSSRRDAFSEAGKGFGATFRPFWPPLRIDYILCPPELEAVLYEVGKVRFSDHYPVIAGYRAND